MDCFRSSLDQFETRIMLQIMELETSSNMIDDIDHLKLSFSAGINELKLLVQDKERLGQIKLTENYFYYWNHMPSVFLHAEVEEPQNGMNAKANYSLIWGKNHQLNCSKENKLTVKTLLNTTLFALLTLLIQCDNLEIRNPLIWTDNDMLQYVIDNIATWKEQGYKKEDGGKRKDIFLMEKVNEILPRMRIKILVSPHETMKNQFYLFKKLARVHIHK